MRYLAVLATLVCAGVCVSSASAGVIADSIPYQGRLTDAADNPVLDGPLDLILSIWTDSVGGTMLHSEVVAVTTSQGLFSACIGCGAVDFSDIFTNQPLFLQTQVAGQPPMTPRTRMRSVPFAISSSSVHSEASNGAARTRGMVIAKPGSIKPHARLLLDADSDGDGNPEFIVTDTATTDGASSRLGHDLDGDGLAERSVWEKVDNSEATIGASVDVDHDGTGDIGVSASADESRTVLRTKFQNGSIPTQSEITDSADASGARVGIRVTNTGQWSSSELRCTPDSAVQTITTGDGSSTIINNMRTRVNDLESRLQAMGLLGARMVLQRCDASTAGLEVSSSSSVSGSDLRAELKAVRDENVDLRLTSDHNGDSVPECMAEATASDKFAQVRGFKVEISGGARSSFGSSCDSAGATSSCDMDSDGDGVSESSVSQLADADSALFSMKHGDAKLQAQLNDQKASLNCGGPGAKNIGLYVGSVSGQCNLTMVDASSGTTDTSIIIDGNLKRFGIGISQPEYPMHHSSGAHLTNGGVWTNASDANLKENFQAVDGAQLLEQLEHLRISQWNYKAESEEVTHIGPTAQDFQETFGVGSDGKSISTIDPSGIALAAIKELNRQNRELKDENESLRNQLEALSEKVDRLASGM